jgi:hypothetical protein
MTYVDFEEVVAESIMTIGLSGDDELAKNFARQLIWRGLQKLGTSDDQLEVCKVDAKNLLIKKPKMKRFDAIALYDANDNYIPHVFHSGSKRIYPNVEECTHTVTTEDGETETFYGPVDLSENRGAFVLGTNGSHVAYALIRYWGFPLDSNGFPLIQECEVEALTLYVRYKWSQRKNENQAEIRENKIAWMEAADWTIAHKKSIDNHGERKKQQAAMLSRMIPNFNRSRY